MLSLRQQIENGKWTVAAQAMKALEEQLVQIGTALKTIAPEFTDQIKLGTGAEKVTKNEAKSATKTK
jgi:hypothetical protein